MNRKINLEQIGPKSAALIRTAADAKTNKQLIKFAEESGVSLGVRPATRLKNALRYFGEIYNETIDLAHSARKAKVEAEKIVKREAIRNEKSMYELETYMYNVFRINSGKKKMTLNAIKKQYSVPKNEKLNWTTLLNSSEPDIKIELWNNQGKTIIVKNKFDIDTRFNVPFFPNWNPKKLQYGELVWVFPPQIESMIWQLRSAEEKGRLEFKKLPKEKRRKIINGQSFREAKIHLSERNLQIMNDIMSSRDGNGVAGSAWQLSEENFIFIFPDEVTPEQKPQSFLAALDKKDHCVFDYITEKVQKSIEQMPNDKNYAALPKKIARLREKYIDGVPDSDLQTVSDELECTITIKDVFDKTIFETKPKRVRFSVAYYNSRKDHLEGLLSQKRTIVKEEELRHIQLALEEQQKLCVFQQCQTGTYALRTAGGTFVLESTYEDAFSEFEKQLEGCKLDAALPVSKFIEYGVRSTASICFSQNYDGYIDQTKSYTQFKVSAFYEGFMGKCTDFRATSKINGVGYYLTTSIDWTHADKKNKRHSA